MTVRWLDSITDSMDMNVSKLWETVKEKLQSVGLQRQTQLRGRTTTSVVSRGRTLC